MAPTKPPQPPPPTEVLCFRRILFLAQQLRYFMDQRLAADGLTTQQAMLLNLVEGASEPPSLKQIADCMATTHQNVKQIVASLERKGFLATGPDPTDRRIRRIAPTRKVATYWKHRDESDFEAVEKQFACLSAAERATLLDLLERLTRSVYQTRLAGRATTEEEPPR